MTDGERWTRGVLADLRARSYRFSAWRMFVAVSFERARDDRRRHRREHHQIMLAGAIGTCAGLATLAWSPLVGVVGIAWWLGVVTMLDWHVGMLERPDGRRLGGIGVPNLLSLARIGGIPLLLVFEPVGIGLAVLVGALTDVADGTLARRRDQVTRLGRWLDGAADGALLVTATLVLTARGVIPVWASALVILRHAAQWAGLAAGYFVRCAPPSSDHIVSAKAAGAIIVAGIATAPFAVGIGIVLIATGAIGGLLAVGITVRRSAADEVIAR